MSSDSLTRTRVRIILVAAGLAAVTVPALAAIVSRFSTAVSRPPAGVMEATQFVGSSNCATLAQQKFEACFDDRGAHFGGVVPPISLRLVGYGRGGELKSVAAVRPRRDGDRVRYAHGEVSAWWRVLPIGFEQGFTIETRPPGLGKLTLALAANKSFEQNDGALSRGKLRYGDLVVTDARGRVVPATLGAKNSRILIVVNDAHASYPLTVDPLVWLEQEVAASDGRAGDSFGWSVAVSGASALVGSPFATVSGNAYQGAAYVFSESNGIWMQSAKLIAGDGAADNQFGMWVALAGKTALVGAPFANGAAGAAYVFGKSNGTWSQTAKLTANDGAAGDDFGWSVALAGKTALIGAPFASVNSHGDQGAAYVFDESNGSWTQASKVIASDGTANDEFGWSVAVDGTTALIGAYGANNHRGAAYVFGKSAGVWTQVQRLTASDGAANDNFGWRVALDGTSALVGADGSNSYTGAAYVFDESDGTWAQAGKLTATDGASGDDFGWSVALAGSNAIIGAAYGNDGTGAAYVFSKSNGTWTQRQELIASNGRAFDGFGWSAALTGATALIGADGAIVNGNSFQGAGYFEGKGDLGLAESAPQSVGQGETYISQTIATNNVDAATPAVTVTVSVPAAASFVSASASQGTCSEASGVVTCAFGQIGGHAGTATANLTLKATGNVGETIDNTASLAKATPRLSASAPTGITGGGACPVGYTEYTGSLNPGERVHSPIYRAPAGSENAILSGGTGFRLYVLFRNARGRKLFRIPGNEVHRRAPAGYFAWVVEAGDNGGAFALCILHP